MPEEPHDKIVLETSTKELVAVAVAGQIKVGDSARITISGLTSDARSKHAKERAEVATTLGVAPEKFFDIQEYEAQEANGSAEETKPKTETTTEPAKPEESPAPETIPEPEKPKDKTSTEKVSPEETFFEGTPAPAPDKDKSKSN